MSPDAAPSCADRDRDPEELRAALLRAADDLSWSAATVRPDPRLQEPLARVLDAMAGQLAELAGEMAGHDVGGPAGTLTHLPAAR